MTTVNVTDREDARHGVCREHVLEDGYARLPSRTITNFVGSGVRGTLLRLYQPPIRSWPTAESLNLRLLKRAAHR